MASTEKINLNVGLACLDIVMVCSSYPKEDSDQRCLSHDWKRGGNASNSSTVMAEFNLPCEYFGTMSTDHGGRFLKQDFLSAGISVENCVFYDDRACPTSVVLLNSQNGSRTIVHSNKNLPELSFNDFKKLNLSRYKWIHFEARPLVQEMKNMIKYIEEWNAKNTKDLIKVSLEIEKPKPSYRELLAFGDVVFISKDVANAYGYTSMVSSAEALSKELKPGATIICAWGEEGACSKAGDGKTYVSKPYPPDKVVDTLAAGDTFIAVTVLCLTKGYSVDRAVDRGCEVAGAKCGMNGLYGLGKFMHLL